MKTVDSIGHTTVAMSTRTCQRNKEANSETIKIIVGSLAASVFPEKRWKAGIPFELVAYCEIDKYAAKAYSLIHGVDESMNLSDITRTAQDLPDFDLVFHGSPCQDFSVAGQQASGEKGSEDTHSSLLWYTVEIVRIQRPRLVMWENVFQRNTCRCSSNTSKRSLIFGYESTFDTAQCKRLRRSTE